MSRTLKETIIPNVGTKDRISMAREFLDANYDIVINEFDTSQSFIRSKIKEYKHAISVDDIYLHLIEEGINIGANVLKMILKSPNYSKTFNPITDYFKQLRGAYRGVSHIDMLCDHIQVRDFEDKEPGYYQARMRRLVRKWIVATAGCVLGYHANDVALGFVAAEEGIGKTWLIRWLIPAELRAYYKQSQADSRVFNMPEEFTRSFIINFDEFVGITRFNAEKFKDTLSSTFISVKRQREEFMSVMPRIASAVFTSNKSQELGGFLYPNMGTRRFGVIEIDNIEKGYATSCDVEQIWAEAVMLLDQDFDYIFNRDDFADFADYNQRYLQVTDSDMLISKHFSKVPENDSEGIYLMSSEILNMLRVGKKIIGSKTVINDITIGQALTKQGFIKRGIRTPQGIRYKYFVKSLL